MTDIVDELSSATARHAVALLLGNRVDFLLKGSAEYIKAQGTLTLINHRGHCFGITNHHVVSKRHEVGTECLFCIGLKKHQQLPGRLIIETSQRNPDMPFDLAVFVLDEALIRDGGKIPIELEESFQPLEQEDQAVAVGFPGVERRMESQSQMGHGMYHVVSQCVCASDRKLILHEELMPPDNRLIRFGGMSGGPIFRLTGACTYAFSGIIFEGRGFHDVRDPTPDSQIWIYGFPFGPAELDRALSIFCPDLKI